MKATRTDLKHFESTATGGVAFDGAHLWVTNSNGNSVTELNASNGNWVQTLSGGSYAFRAPSAIAFDGTHLWATNSSGN